MRLCAAGPARTLARMRPGAAAAPGAAPPCGTRGALPSTMVVTSISSRALAMPPSQRLSDVAPRILDSVAGGILELVIHVVEGWRDRRDRIDR